MQKSAILFLKENNAFLLVILVIFYFSINVNLSVALWKNTLASKN